MTNKTRFVRRHSRGAMIMHWFNAVMFILLLLGGLGMLRNPDVAVVGLWWSRLLDGIFGADALLRGHIALGVLWMAGVLLYAVFYVRLDVIPFLREIFRLKPGSDLTWCLRKTLRLTIGVRWMKKSGLDPALPPQSFYNAGQKVAAIAVLVCGMVLAGSGTILCLNTVMDMGTQLTQWCMFFHLLCAGIMGMVLPIHIYMAVLAPGEGPALRSMFTGTVPEDFIRHHNPLWHEELFGKEAAVDNET